ncbi:type II secretion system F family protein [Prauserella oleivorans]|uniref:Type II secretion system F family protein n=1 Tax=Prauserella oleivorans TaxID=1478153 RepID=A0ABW5W799_9PSEU
MLTWSALTGAVAVLAWPGPVARHRLARLTRSVRKRPALAVIRDRASWPRLAVAAAALALPVIVALAGVAATAAIALLALALSLHVRARRRTRRRIEATARLAEAVRTLVGGLRAGAHPAAAAETAAHDADDHTASVLTAIAASARLGGEPDAERLAVAGAVPADVVHRLVAAWSLARRHGLPLAGVLEAVQRDVDAQVRLAGQLDARLAGPRASSAILAVLPALGVLLGQVMGAAPLDVLLTTSPGRVLLVLGSALVLAGVAWSTALTSRVTLR